MEIKVIKIYYNIFYLHVLLHQIQHFKVNAQCRFAVVNHAQSEYKHSLTFHIRRSVVIAMKPMHRLQICQ